MKVLILGTGKMGCGVALDLVQNEAVSLVGMVDVSQTALDQVKAKALCAHKVADDKIVLHKADVTNAAEIQSVMAQYDVGVITLANRYLSYKAIEAAIETKLDTVDILEEYHRRPDVDEIEGLEIPEGMSLNDYGDWLHERAKAQDVLLLDGMGFAPGLSNLVLGEGIRKLDRADVAVARVGGIPAKEIADQHPLRYVITWAFSHVLREYMVKVKVIKDGEIVVVDAATERESFCFDRLGHNDDLVCAVTPGMPSFIYTHPELQEFAEKTVRWPGHWSGVQTLKECGLLDLEPVSFDGVSVVPRNFLNAVIEPKLRPVGKEVNDVCIMWGSVEGEKDGQPQRFDYYLWEKADCESGISAMARVTAFPAAIAAVMIGQGKIKQAGIVPPEEAIYGDLYAEFIEELKKRDITILEVKDGAASN